MTRNRFFSSRCSVQGKSRSFSRGFTLFEVMIALAILSFSILAMVKQAGQSVMVASALQDKTLAFWLAENKLAELRILPEWPGTGTFEENKITMAGRNWYLEYKVEDAPSKGLRRIDVSVSDMANKDRVITTVVGFIGKN